MKRGALTAFVFLISVLALAAPAALSGDAAAAPDTVIKGRIVTGFNLDGSVAVLEDVTVEILDKDTEDVVDSYTTGADGRFTVDATSGTTYIIRFGHTSYDVLVWPLATYTVPPNDTVHMIDVGAADIDLGDIVMMEAPATITGTVTRGGIGRGNITVEVQDAEGNVLRTSRTDSDGKFKILFITGDYTVAVNHPLYESISYDVHLMIGETETCDFELVPKQGDPYLFDLDLTHSLMLIGGIMGLFLLIFIILYRIHIERNPERSRVYTETKKKEKDQE